MRRSFQLRQMVRYQEFQSTHPSWGATQACKVADIDWSDFNPRTHRGVRLNNFASFNNFINISIHAPIVGCDDNGDTIISLVADFNPRTHRGVRPFITSFWSLSPAVFQSTHPSWGATLFHDHRRICKEISIHAPIVGCDH